ncbi:MAG TPA: ABC transporter permease [Burkholderiaceae bacterium]|nr:ABC transporter permease [Burkholderiaceae bacterium]
MKLAGLTRSAQFWPTVVLLLLLAVNLVLNPNFFALSWREGHLYGAPVDILNRAAPLMAVALGMTVVIATRGIDISVGAVVAIAAAVAAALIGGKLVIVDGQQTYVTLTSMPIALLAALAVAALCGLFNGTLVAVVGIQPIIATLILMVAGRGIAQLITNGQIITIYYKPYFFVGNGYLLGLPFSLWQVGALFAVMAWLKHRTALGLFIQASGGNPAAARLAGINARGLLLAVYAFCGFTAGMAGLMISSNVKSADGNNAGLLLELDAILAVTLGGTSLAGGRFSLRGSVLGALIIQTLTTSIYALGVPPEINLVVKAVVVFAVCLVQSPEARAWVFRRRSPA